MKRAVHIALLRGINVGTAKRVAMTDLRVLLEELGYGDVRTLLNSGNIVFSAAKAEPRKAALRIEKALSVKLRVLARVLVLSAEELDEVVERNPLGRVADNPSRLLVGILSDAADQEKLAEIAKKEWGKERISLGEVRSGTKPAGGKGAARAFYMWMPEGVIKSKLNAAVSKVLGDQVTARNWATMLKLKEMAGEVGFDG
ncbi:MAG: DUF1697 domain-containing protein [Spirochaetia bacterium]|jgi:uncharacterized protein (DUF1697 family)